MLPNIDYLLVFSGQIHESAESCIVGYIVFVMNSDVISNSNHFVNLL